MTQSIDVIVIFDKAVSIPRPLRFKIYDNVSGSWFGAEVVREDCEVEISTDKHTNVVLPAGSYTVIFNVSDRSITLIPA